MADNLAMIRMERGRPARGARDSAGRGPAGLPFGGLALLSLPVLLFIKCRQAHTKERKHERKDTMTATRPDRLCGLDRHQLASSCGLTA